MPQLTPLVAELRVKTSDLHAKFKEAMADSDKLAAKTVSATEVSDAAYTKFSKAGQVAFTAVGVGVGAVIGESARMAADFQEKMTLLVTGAGESEDKVKEVSAGILDMAPKVQTSSSKLADGMYMIESAGFHGADGLNVLKAAAEGAKVGNADMGTTADALTTAMKDYHLPASKAADVTSQLVATVGRGKTHMQDLGQAMSSILPFSSGLGVSLQDTLGAMATMTGEGVNASNAATYLKFSMMALANETPKGAKALKNVGLSSIQVATDLKSKGMSGTLAEITDAIGKKFPAGSAQYNAALSDITGGTRGMAAALALTGGNMATYKKNIGSIGGATATAGGDVQGFGKTSEDLNNKLAGMGASFESVGVRIGTGLIPMLSAGVDKFMTLFNYLSTHQSVLIALGVVLGAVLIPLMTIFAVKTIGDTAKAAVGYAKMGKSMLDTVRLMVMYGKDAVKAGAMSAVSAVKAGVAWAVNGAKGVVDSVRLMVMYGAQAVANGARSVGAAVATGASWVASGAATVGSFIASTAAAGAHMVVLGALKVAQYASAAAQWAFNVAMDANPIGLIVIGIAALVGGFILAYNKVGWFKDGVNVAFKFIQDVVGNVVNWFKGSFVPWMSAVWNTAVLALQIMIGFYVNGFNNIRNVVGAVVGWFMTYVVGTYVSVFATIGSTVLNAVNYFLNFASGVSGAVGNVMGFIGGLPGRILGALGGLGSMLFNAGANAIQGLINGISSMIGNVGKAIGDVVGAIANFLPHSPAKKGPLSGRGYTLYSGQKMIEDLGVGMLNGLGGVNDASNAVMLASSPNRGLGGSSGFGQFGTASGNGSNPSTGAMPVGNVTNNNVTVNATTNANPREIASEMGYQLLLQG